MKATILSLILTFYLMNSYAQTYDTLLDNRDKKKYLTVKIENQTWMAQNLAYTKNKSIKYYWDHPFIADDTLAIRIPNLSLKELLKKEDDDFVGLTLLKTYVNGRYIVYQLDTSKIKKYGILYNFKSAANACPSGWHLPSDDEFQTLLKNVNKNNKNVYSALIEDGESGFNAVFAGSLILEHFENYGFYWSSTPDKFETASKCLDINKNLRKVKLIKHFYKNFNSVRCIKDVEGKNLN